MDEREIVRRWLNRFAHSAATQELDKHMALISREVQTILPDGRIVDYAGWRKRRQNEFDKGLLLRLVHEEPDIVSAGEREIVFLIRENIRGSRGEKYTLRKESTLALEGDEQWRLVFERIDSVQCGLRQPGGE